MLCTFIAVMRFLRVNQKNVPGCYVPGVPINSATAYCNMMSLSDIYLLQITCRSLGSGRYITLIAYSFHCI